MRVPNMKEENSVKNKDLPPNSREKLLLHQRPGPHKLLKLVNTVLNLPTIFLQFLEAQKQLFQKA